MSIDIHILNIIKDIIPKSELIAHIKSLTTDKTIQKQLFVALQNQRGEDIQKKDLDEFTSIEPPL